MQGHEIFGFDQLVVLDGGVEPEALHVQPEVVSQLLFLPHCVCSQQEVFLVLLPVETARREVVIFGDFELHFIIFLLLGAD
jgi:hypothetical protein